jgi:hypothetical protein
MFTFGPCLTGRKSDLDLKSPQDLRVSYRRKIHFSAASDPTPRTRERLATGFADAVLTPELMQGFLVRALAML